MRHDIFEVTREPIDKLGLEKRLLTGGARSRVTVTASCATIRKAAASSACSTKPTSRWPSKRCGASAPRFASQWFDVERVGIIHRFGPLKISESSVVIVVTSPHRRVAFEACRYAIDRLETDRAHLEEGDFRGRRGMG